MLSLQALLEGQDAAGTTQRETSTATFHLRLEYAYALLQAKNYAKGLYVVANICHKFNAARKAEAQPTTSRDTVASSPGKRNNNPPAKDEVKPAEKSSSVEPGIAADVPLSVQISAFATLGYVLLCIVGALQKRMTHIVFC